MSSGIEVRDVRVSLVWVAHHLDGVGTEAAGETPIPLTRDDLYFEAFARARSARPPVEWVLPWHHPRGDNFWNFYLERADLNVASAADAWTGLIPLRRASEETLVAAQPGVSTRLSLYVFPFAVAAEITLRIRLIGEWTLEKAVDRIIELRHDGRFVPSADGSSEPSLRLEALGERSIGRVRYDLFSGRTSPPPLAPLSAFSVVTIMQAGGDKLKEAVTDGGTVHRALQALCRWSPTWKEDQLLGLADSRCLPRSAAPVSHIVLRSTRGRVIWFPLLAAPPVTGATTQSTLGCYHRNLVAAALQTEGQALLVRWLDLRLAAWGDLPGVIQTWGRRAAGSLTRLYLGKSTYKSGSCRAHVDDSESVPALNRLRARLGMPST